MQRDAEAGIIKYKVSFTDSIVKAAPEYRKKMDDFPVDRTEDVRYTNTYQ